MILRLSIAILYLATISYSFAQTSPSPVGHGHYIIGVTAVDSPVDITRKRIAVGEEVYLNFEPAHPCNWKIVSGGGTISKNGETGAIFTAPENTNQGDTTVIKATCHKQGSATVTYTIVKPAGVVMEKAQPDTNRTSPLFVRMILTGYITPNDVNFHKISVKEDVCHAVASGYFAPINGAPHPASLDWVKMNGHVATKGTRIDGLDEVKMGGPSTDYILGNFLWAIPWKYKVNTEQGVFATVNHVAKMQVSGNIATLSESKGGASTSISENKP